jgi:large subunit ribosomal protein L11
MAKDIKIKIRLQIPAGAATPAPPVGSMLGPHGINLMKFCTEFNNATKDKKGEIVPVIITVFVDKSFEIEYKTAPVSALIKKYANVQKGAKNVGTEKVGTITRDQALKIAEIKMQDLNTISLEAAVKSVCGSARSMGIDVV